MSLSTLWRDYNTQRHRRYRAMARLIALGRPYLSQRRLALTPFEETAARAQELSKFGLALLGEQFDAEKKLSRDIRTLVGECKHFHTLILKDSYRELEHDLLDADMHLHVLGELIVGHRAHLKNTLWLNSH